MSKAFAKNKISHLLGHVLRSFELASRGYFVNRFATLTDALRVGRSETFGLRAFHWFPAIGKSRPHQTKRWFAVDLRGVRIGKSAPREQLEELFSLICLKAGQDITNADGN